MTREIDLREWPEDRRREQLFDALADATTGDELELVAEQDPDPHLLRYQIERDRALAWEHADPDAEPRALRVTVGDSLDQTLPAIDVRNLKPQRRHETLLDVFEELAAGEGFVLVNDHDPKPLYHELRSMHGDVVGWEYASRDSSEWRVETTKTGDSEATDDDILTRYNVREIPKEERHPTIHHRYGMIPAGETMEIVAPHEPRPLRREFRGQYGDSFAWEVVESEPGYCRVHITKAEQETQSQQSGDDTATESDTGAAPAADEHIEVTEELDVRDLPPAQRHEQVFEAYDALSGGEGFVLVNDHDPKPLYHQFDAEAGPEFRWTYRQREHGEFRVLIGKARTGDVASEEPAPF